MALSNPKSHSILYEAAFLFLVDQRIGLSNFIHNDWADLLGYVAVSLKPAWWLISAAKWKL
jgi:hypothetical protein